MKVLHCPGHWQETTDLSECTGLKLDKTPKQIQDKVRTIRRKVWLPSLNCTKLFHCKCSILSASLLALSFLTIVLQNIQVWKPCIPHCTVWPLWRSHYIAFLGRGNKCLFLKLQKTSKSEVLWILQHFVLAMEEKLIHLYKHNVEISLVQQHLYSWYN